jgi:predicted GIY-YIG superfamily endonuclease
MDYYRPVVYRLWCDETLLYIGMTMDFRRRIDEHATFKPWFRFVERFTLEPHATLKQAEAAERAAIMTERPVFNIAHNDRGAEERQRKFWDEYGWDSRSSGYAPKYERTLQLLTRRYGNCLRLGTTLEPFIAELDRKVESLIGR